MSDKKARDAPLAEITDGINKDLIVTIFESLSYIQPLKRMFKTARESFCKYCREVRELLKLLSAGKEVLLKI